DTFAREKQLIADAIRPHPLAAAMFEKNWNRYAAVTHFAVSHLKIDPGKPILDYGSGFPFVSKLLTLLGYQVCSYEPYASEGEREIARALGLESLYTTRLDPGAQFACVFMVDVIEHLSIIKETMLDVNRRTSPGGYLVVSTPNVLRIEMWLRFLMRQTGHPQAIETFVRADNNYAAHQREFTMGELQYTLRHYGFKPVHLDTADTNPSPDSLSRYHQLLGKKTSAPSAKHRLKEGVMNGFRSAFPRQFANNLLVIGRKE
ncbi:MAG: methyltransferase domain-containing protein, partial [Cytophagales bacterium]|nr:methyltransferase domain-containing protein [Cytophagales bacterium]